MFHKSGRAHPDARNERPDYERVWNFCAQPNSKKKPNEKEPPIVNLGRMALSLTFLLAAPSLIACPPQSQDEAQSPKACCPQVSKHRLGPVHVSINWRSRVESWDWFKASGGNNSYEFGDSLLRVGIGQSSDRLDWFLEASAPLILGLPTNAVLPSPEGQLGLGGTYYAANGSRSNNANLFMKQAYVRFTFPHTTTLQAGRFEYFDGLELTSSDALLATVVRTRIASRLISNFGFSAVQRSFDGLQFSWKFANNSVTLLAVRPTAGVFQTSGMGELDVDVYYGAFNKSVHSNYGAGQLRVFSLGYIDHRSTVLKTDNRPQSERAADFGKIEIATTGADYAHVFHSSRSGDFDFLAWGAMQTGSWGALQQRAGALVGEVGWKPDVRKLKPWISAGYSYGSGDGNPNDNYHGTFFQVLTTPRQYAQFPFYNMMNNKDVYMTVNLQPAKRVTLRSEWHNLRLANPADLWYLGGGAFQGNTFGYTGRPSNGHRNLADVGDFNVTYEFNRNFSATAYYAHAWGGNVIGSIYSSGANADFAYLETDFRF